jgi:hypothetical protein
VSDTAVAADSTHPTSTARFDSTGPEHCIQRRPDGIYADPAVLGTTVLAAIDSILRSGSILQGLDYRS